MVPDPTAWTGQRLPFFIELRAAGSFVGAAAFDLPAIPATVIVKVGSPVLSSETDDNREFFVQRHEFALFSQADGPLELPPVTARFSHRNGYSGPSFDAVASTSAEALSLRRPPGSKDLGFIVTTASLNITESWNPTPGPLETGAVLKRTITQRAAEMTGMALAPAPKTAPNGIRVYPGEPEVTDKTERGEFLGERRETITYLVQQAGLHTLPAIRYGWWNPTTETLETRTLPAVTFTATAPPVPSEKPSPARFLWLLVLVAVLTAIIRFRRPLTELVGRIHAYLDPPPRRATRRFLSACRHNHPEHAARDWVQWKNTHPGFEPSPELREQLLLLQRHFYGPIPLSAPWSGHSLAKAFRDSTVLRVASPATSPLPPLNP